MRRLKMSELHRWCISNVDLDGPNGKGISAAIVAPGQDIFGDVGPWSPELPLAVSRELVPRAFRSRNPVRDIEPLRVDWLKDSTLIWNW